MRCKYFSPRGHFDGFSPCPLGNKICLNQRKRCMYINDTVREEKNYIIIFNKEVSLYFISLVTEQAIYK